MKSERAICTRLFITGDRVYNITGDPGLINGAGLSARAISTDLLSGVTARDQRRGISVIGKILKRNLAIPAIVHRLSGKHQLC